MICNIDNIDLYYEELGSGFPVVFLHGWGANIKSWGTVLQNIALNHKVYAVDFPGFGNTPPPTDAWGVEEYTDLIIAFLDKLQIKKCNIVCHSFGGRVSIILANKRPDLINKMVFTDAAGVKPKRTYKYYFRVYKFKLYKKIYKSKGLTNLAKKLGVDVENKVKKAGSADYKALSDHMKKVFVKVVNLDLTDMLQNIKAPTLLVWGDLDTDTPLYMANIMKEKIKDSGLVVIKGGNHFSYLYDIPRYCKIVNVFFGG